MWWMIINDIQLGHLYYCTLNDYWAMLAFCWVWFYWHTCFLWLQVENMSIKPCAWLQCNDPSQVITQWTEVLLLGLIDMFSTCNHKKQVCQSDQTQQQNLSPIVIQPIRSCTLLHGKMNRIPPWPWCKISSWHLTVLCSQVVGSLLRRWHWWIFSELIKWLNHMDWCR